mmetsp:Transcript_28315/g.60789  ORF Transcript_28315/g.60789 Transcript_28315/m.60789 type:complete len:804 (+) Transcript_28315:188-2599(+)
MYHHQRIHHHSRSTSPHDSPPRHSPPHDPHYAYSQPYATSSAAHRSCPHCSAPSTSFHMDGMAGDLICTQCGAVLDEHLRDETAEWRDYNNLEDAARGSRSRCGELVDESKYVGGLVPTKMSATVFAGTGIGGTGSGAGAGTSEEKRRLAIVRGRLKRTHNMIENLIDQKQKARYAEVVLERKARDARLGRGEVDGNNEGEEGGITVDGDYEGLMTRRDQQEAMSVIPASAKSSPSTNDHEKAFQSLKNKKWSLADAILLRGTLDQVQQWAHSTSPSGEEWTQSSLEAERIAHTKKFDVAARSSLQRLYTAFTILDKAAHNLQLSGPSNQTFREAISWFLKFVAKNDGLRVKGISSGSSSFKSGEKNAKRSALLLSLFGTKGMIVPAAASSKSKSASLPTELHRLRQYASLGSAILYISAKRTGVGRTLTEVCSAFGTYAVINSNSDGDGEADEPLVRPKYCSRAMQELRTTLPEVVLPIGEREGTELATTQNMAASLPSPLPSSDVPMSDKGGRGPAEVTPTYSSTGATSTVPVKSEFIPDDDRISSINSRQMVNNTDEAALVDLVARMATSLNLPPCAISAATVVAIQCARNARASITTAKAPPTKRNSGIAHIRPRRKAKAPPPSSDVIAVASLLLVCTAGGTVQRLARQALSNRKAASFQNHQVTSGGTTNSMSNPLDDLHEELSYPATPKPEPVGSMASIETSTSAPLNNHATVEQRTLSSWAAWNAQPPWHRDVSHLEGSTGVPRKTIIAYYSGVLHPRRSHFLGVTKKEEEDIASAAGLLLHNIVAAVPLMSLRNL